MAGDDAAVFHFMNPIAGFRNRRIVGDKKQRLLALVHEILEQLEGAFRIQSIKVAGRFIGQDHGRIVGERARYRHALLFATGKMPAGTAPLVTKIDSFKQCPGAIEHLFF